MKQLSRKKIVLSILLLLVIYIVILTYQVLRIDPSLLVQQYPHNVSKDPLTTEFDVQPGRPKGWVLLSEISTYGKWGIILSEDWGFYQHEGVDFEQLKIAINEGLEDKRLRGASTITQQMVKNVYLTHDRSIFRKLQELYLTYEVEKQLKKQRILEIYFNIIEFAPGVFGIKKASFYYFKKHPSALTPREGAFLAMLLPSPKRYSISFKKKRLTRFAQIRVKAILKKMRMAKIITPEQFEFEIQQKFSWET